MLRMCVCMHSRFVENHQILEDRLLISEVVLSQSAATPELQTSKLDICQRTVFIFSANLLSCLRRGTRISCSTFHHSYFHLPIFLSATHIFHLTYHLRAHTLHCQISY
jgi:hypothetical protein